MSDKTINDGGPAFPKTDTVVPLNEHGEPTGLVNHQSDGLSLRAYIARKALHTQETNK
jgi:hypothetical protein